MLSFFSILISFTIITATNFLNMVRNEKFGKWYVQTLNHRDKTYKWILTEDFKLIFRNNLRYGRFEQPNNDFDLKFSQLKEVLKNVPTGMNLNELVN